MASILFIELCEVFEAIEKTTKRLEIQSMLSSFFKKVIVEDPKSLSSILFLSNASTHPEYYNKELGIGDFLILTAVSDATGLSAKEIRRQLVKSGDMGIIAMNNRVNRLFIAKKQLTCQYVLEKLREICEISGKDSTNARKIIINSLICQSSPLEIKFLIRLFSGKLRIGLALQTILISLSLAYDESDYSIIKDAYDKQSDFNNLTDLLFKYGIKEILTHATIVPSIPLKPMLAQPSKNLTKALSKFENSKFLSEYKYDGERIQVHFFDKTIKLFSRNCEDITNKYPELSQIKINDKSFIIDGEAVAYRDGEILPFQILSTRKRKNEEFLDEKKEVLPSVFLINKRQALDENRAPKEMQSDTETMQEVRKQKNLQKIEEGVSICIFCFDILFYDGQELISLPLSERRKILHSNFKEIDYKFKFASGNETQDVDQVDAQFKMAIQSKCEGLMLKALDSIYKPSQRSNFWVKLKKDYIEALGDSVDLVVLGGYHGKGKRVGVYGAFLLGTYNDETDKYEPCCKIGTGFNDANLKLFNDLLSSTICSKSLDISCSEKIDQPDVWFDPKHVWEVKAASMSLSTVYTNGDSGKGISLRFPRFIRERDDKDPKDATTANQLYSMYLNSMDEESEEDDFN